MTKVFGVERDTCEYPDCDEEAVVLIVHSLSSGLNTHVLCEKHRKELVKK